MLFSCGDIVCRLPTELGQIAVSVRPLQTTTGSDSIQTCKIRDENCKMTANNVKIPQLIENLCKIKKILWECRIEELFWFDSANLWHKGELLQPGQRVPLWSQNHIRHEAENCPEETAGPLWSSPTHPLQMSKVRGFTDFKTCHIKKPDRRSCSCCKSKT